MSPALEFLRYIAGLPSMSGTMIVRFDKDERRPRGFPRGSMKGRDINGARYYHVRTAAVIHWLDTYKPEAA